MTVVEWQKEASAAADTIEDLRAQLAAKTRAFDAMRVTNLDLVRRLADAVAGQMVLRARVVELERALAERRDWRVH